MCDALINARVHKPAFSHEEARRLILEGRGRHFDPDVTDAFSANASQFAAITAALKDETV